MPKKQKTMKLALCESRHLVLRPFQKYIFVPLEGCKECQEMYEQFKQDFPTLAK